MIDYQNVTLSVIDQSGKKVGQLFTPNLKNTAQAYDISLTHEGNGWKELSFSIRRKIDGVNNPLADCLVNEYIVQVDDGNYRDRFIISEPNLSHNRGSMTISAKCSHISARLRTKKLYLVFDDTNGIGKCHELASIILQGTGWTLGNVDTFYETDGVTEKIRSLKSSGKEGAYQLLSKLCDLFNARPAYNGETQTVDIVAFAPYTFQPGSKYPTLKNPDDIIELNYSKAMSGVVRTLNTDNLVTRLFVEGEYGDNGYLGIESVNPTGMNFILNFDYLQAVGLFTSLHQQKVDQYLLDIKAVQDALKASSLSMSGHETELMKLWGTADYSLFDIVSVIERDRFSINHVASLSDEQGIEEGQHVRILYSDGTHLVTTVKTVSPLYIETSDEIPTGKTATGILVYRTLSSGSIGGKESAVESAIIMRDSLTQRLGDNLVLDSDNRKTSTQPLIGNYSLSEDWVVGKEYTLSIWGSINEGNNFHAYRDDGHTSLPDPVYDASRKCWIVTFTCPSTSRVDKRTLRVVNLPSNTATSATINRIKVEFGSIPTYWSAAKDSSQSDLVQEYNDRIDLLYNGDAETEGIYSLTAKAVNLARLLATNKGEYRALTQQSSDIEAQFSLDMGDLLRDGYWQDSNYIVGQEQNLFDDAVDTLKVMSKPVATYNLSISNMKGMDDTPLIKASVSSAAHIIDEEAAINEWGYVEKTTYVLDNPLKNNISVATKEAKFAGQSFTDVLSQIAETSRDVRSMKDVYKRAEIIDKAGNISTKTLQGVIDAEITKLMSSTSNWYTDERGNLILLSHDGLSAMMLTGEGFMISQSKKPTGEWNWRTFGTGRGFTADEITSGTLNAGLIKILGTDQFYWDADNIHVIDPANPLRQIRMGRYDGQNYGIGFTTNGGETWGLAFGFRGIDLTQSILPAENIDGLGDAITENLPDIPIIDKIEAEYYLSTSPLELLNGSWSTVPPAWENGKYYWIRTKTTYVGDKPPDYTNPACVTGAAGEAGESAYSVDIVSTNGNIFRNGIVHATLRAVVRYGDEDITETIDSNRFRWTRVSADTASDTLWNAQHFSGSKEITITDEDVSFKASFYCDVIQ